MSIDYDAGQKNRMQIHSVQICMLSHLSILTLFALCKLSVSSCQCMYVYITQYCCCRFHSTFHTRVSHSMWKQTTVYVCDIELILIVMSMYVSERENCHFRKYIYRKIRNFFCVHISCSFVVHFFEIKKLLFCIKYFVHCLILMSNCRQMVD